MSGQWLTASPIESDPELFCLLLLGNIVTMKHLNVYRSNVPQGISLLMAESVVGSPENRQ